MAFIYSVFNLLLLNVIVVTAQWVIEDEGCRTPNRGVGNCILIQECEPMMTVLRKVSKPLTPEIAQLLRDYQCGYDGGSVKVCCPSTPIIINTLTKPNPTTPPDVSNHKNFKLLPIKKCGLVSSDNRIWNGNKTALFEFPWMALLSYRKSKGPEFQCGGSIINNKYILTAAHCLVGQKSPLIGVRIGEHDLRTTTDCEVQEGERICAPPVQDLVIEEIIPHENYNSTTYSNDIGLLRVQTMNLSVENAQPVCLPLENNRNLNFTGKNVIVIGFGVTETGRSSPDLLKVDLPIVSDEECRRRYQEVTKITNRQICAGGRGGKDSCGGDSGGPLHDLAYQTKDTRFVQQGIVSFGPRWCGNDGNPGVYTRVAWYMDWILNNLRP